MKRPVAVLALGVLFAVPLLSQADEPPHMDFVRGLRERQYNDLALEYLEKLRQDPPSEEVARVLPLELAKCRLEKARGEDEPGKRLALYGQARRELEEFLKKNAQHTRAAEAQLEIVNIAVVQGKTQLSQALRLEGPARLAAALKAREALVDAGTRLKQMADQLGEKLAALPEPKTPQERADRKALQQAKLRADFDLGLNYLDQAQSYVNEGNTAEAKLRAKVVEQAVAVLQKVSDFDAVSPVCWQAQAWLGRAFHEKGETKKARGEFNKVLSADARSAESGKALARYFYLLLAQEAPDPSDPPLIKDPIKGGEAWLQTYAAYANTPEGQGLRFLLAETYARLARDPKTNRDLKQSHLRRARTLYRQLEQTDSDYTDRARQGKIGVIQEMGGLTVPVNTLRTFEDCYVRAQYEAYMVGEEARTIKDPKKYEAQRKTRIQAMEDALKLALKLEDKEKPRPSDNDLSSANTLLAYVYLAKEDYSAAIALGEKLARARPLPREAGTAAGYALRAYGQVLADPDKADLKTDKQVDEYRERMRQLAVYMESTWPDEPAGDLARHQLALLLIKDKKLAEAVDVLERIKPSYSSAIYVKYQMALSALQLQGDADKAKPNNSDRRYQQRALAALESLGNLPADADPDLARTYLLARIELCRELYKLKKYDQMKAVSRPLLDGLAKMPLAGDAVRAEMRAALEGLILFAEYGRAEAEYSAGRYAKTLEVLDPLLAQVKKGDYPELKKNPPLRWGLLGLALRANVQQGKTDRAREVLNLFRDLAKDDPEGGGATAALLPLVQLLKEQVEELRKKGPSAKDQLKKTTESFETFLDEAAKQEKPAPETVLYLAQGYSSLEKHDKAVALLKAVPEPKDGDAKKQAYYQAIRVLYIRELRLGGKLKDAKEAMDEIMGTAKGPGWGQGNLEALKERNFLLEAEGNYSQAVVNWDAMLRKQLLPRIKEASIKDQYLECYYNLVSCYVRYALALPKEEDRKKQMAKAAGFITRLADGWPDLGGDASKARFLDLIDRESQLKEQAAIKELYAKLKTS